jgi:hypothetical protein
MFLTRLALIFILAETPPSPGPTLAREDTMHTSVPEVLVRAPRVTLDEILDRVARGETRREAALQDQQFTATFRLTTQARPDSQPILVSERVMRVYKRKPNLVRTEVLREYDRDKRTRSNVEVRFRGGMDEEIVNFAFRPASRREFRYRILGRDLVGGHLIYRIAFEPRSPLDPTAPSGTVWVDTNDFVILRQEIQYTRSPAPLFVRGV